MKEYDGILQREYLKQSEIKCMGEIWEEVLKFNDEYFSNWRNVEEVYYSNALVG